MPPTQALDQTGSEQLCANTTQKQTGVTTQRSTTPVRVCVGTAAHLEHVQTITSHSSPFHLPTHSRTQSSSMPHLRHSCSHSFWSAFRKALYPYAFVRKTISIAADSPASKCLDGGLSDGSSTTVPTWFYSTSVHSREGFWRRQLPFCSLLKML